ncbi:MAG: hypothetical protein ACMUIP_11415 [bacterium]
MPGKYRNILSLLHIKPPPLSVDYVNHKKQFQLHTLLTEQRHPNTWNLSFTIKKHVEEGLRQILSADEDISQKFFEVAEDPSVLIRACQAASQAIREGKKIVIYGCGASGRLAKQMESAMWRPFWKEMKKGSLWERVKSTLPEDIEDRLIGEMTGGDRALISSLEGFEDLQLVGRLQMEERHVEKDDTVFCITEGGETSSVIGAMLAALEKYGVLTKDTIEEALHHLFFLYNNPDDQLTTFARSRLVMENPAITKINLTTGPQAITGSTRMQATTAATFIMGIILQETIRSLLEGIIDEEELALLGFHKKTGIQQQLRSFDDVRKLIMDSLKDVARFTRLESKTYQNHGRAFYFSKKSLITVFIDCAERSPTFRLDPLDTIHEKERRSWLQVWTDGKDYKQAWYNLLGRNFRGLKEPFYKSHFVSKISDAYLKEAALRSLSQAGHDQEWLYDFSFAEENINGRGPHQGDLGVVVCLDEEIDALAESTSSFNRFIRLFKRKNISMALVLIGDRDPQKVTMILSRLPLNPEQDVVISIRMDQTDDALNLKKQIALKIFLNAHSTGVMARLGKVVGNTMTHVNPGNFKLIGRATSMIMSHVNTMLLQDEWIRMNEKTAPITYAQANAVLFSAMDFVSGLGRETSEVALSIIRILEALRRKEYVSWEEALSIIECVGLENYIQT